MGLPKDLLVQLGQTMARQDKTLAESERVRLKTAKLLKDVKEAPGIKKDEDKETGPPQSDTP